MSQEKYGGIANSAQLSEIVHEANHLIDEGRHDFRLRTIPPEVQEYFLLQAEHRTLGEPSGGYELALRRYPETVTFPKTPEARLIDGHDALVQVRFDGRFTDPDRSFIRVLYGIADTALDGTQPNYVAKRELINHYGLTMETIDVRDKDPDEPLTDDGLTARGLLEVFGTLGQRPDFSEVEFADAFKVARTGESLTDEEVMQIEVDQVGKNLTANMDRELGALDVSTEESTALLGVLRYLKQLPPGAPELSLSPLPPLT